MKPADTRSVAELVQSVNAGARSKYVFFWSHAEAKGGPVSKACFSQWYVAPFCVDDQIFPTAEHYMMAAKARLFHDQTMLTRILAAPGPAEAKVLGRQVQGFDEQVWASHRYDVVVTGNHEKFGQNPTLLAFLLATKRRVLVEASPRDRIWGIGLSADNERAGNPRHWNGLNLLGFALMEARSRLSSLNHHGMVHSENGG